MFSSEAISNADHRPEPSFEISEEREESKVTIANQRLDAVHESLWVMVRDAGEC